MLHRWLNTPLLVDVWNHGRNVTFEEVRAKYEPRIRGEQPTDPYLILLDGRPSGYVQTYLCADYAADFPWFGDLEHTASVDIFIGEEEYRGRGLGAPILRRFLDLHVFSRTGVRRCVILPAERNARAIRTYEKAGFRSVGTGHDPEPEPVRLMMLERCDFVRVVPAEDRHAPQLAGLSRDFASEQPWAVTLPIGQILTVEAARQRLFGPDVVIALMAETLDGTAVGYMGVSRFFVDGDAHYEASILVGRDWRRKGVGRALVEEAFLRLPPGICVEAWVAEMNKASLAAVERFRYRLYRLLEDEGRVVHVYCRRTP